MATGLAQFAPTLQTFFAWWSGELRSLVPPRLLQLLNPRSDRLEVAFTADAAAFRWFRKRGLVELGQIALAGEPDDGVADAVQRLLLPARGAHRHVDIVLPADQIIATTLEFPAAAEADLRQLLSFEMDRLTPFRADAVCFDYRIVDRDRATRRLRLLLEVVPRASVDAAMARVRSWGLAVGRVVGEAGVPGQPGWVIVDDAAGRRPGRLQVAVTGVLAACAVALLVAIVYVPLEQKRQRVRALGAMVAEARGVAVEAGELQNRLNSLRSEQRFLVERKRRQPPFVVILNEISTILPDDTWLFRLQYRAGEVQAYGHSQAASALIGQIGGSPMFQDPSFRAPVMRDPAAEAERFHLTFRVAPPPPAAEAAKP